MAVIRYAEGVIKEKNMTPKRGAIGPKLSPRHGAARLRFALEHVWTKEQWSSVLFTCSQMRAELVYMQTTDEQEFTGDQESAFPSAVFTKL